MVKRMIKTKQTKAVAICSAIARTNIGFGKALSSHYGTGFVKALSSYRSIRFGRSTIDSCHFAKFGATTHGAVVTNHTIFDFRVSTNSAS
jgi:hypothetical protein